MTNYNVGINATNLKCIGTSSQGFSDLSLINIIIGRNNSGKSSLLDLIEIATTEKLKDDRALWHSGREPTVLLDFKITLEMIARFFPANMSGGDLIEHRGESHYDYGARHYTDARVIAKFSGGNDRQFVHIFDPLNPEKEYPLPAGAKAYLNNMCSLRELNPFRGMEFRRLHAERNVQREGSDQTIRISGDGRGATNAIQNFLNNASLDRSLVQKRILADLNSIFGPDTIFNEIVCRIHQPENAWEIFLDEKNKGLISLSNSGSGLKTVILALCLIHMEPVLAGKSLDQFIFAFEELENNLHPAIQRRLLSYLAAQSAAHKFPLFLTTHSSIAIDLFNKNPDAQILHVTHNGSHSTVTPVRAYVESRGILDDLDVRASDLLQSNGIIWVEGPSDRVYLNHWLNTWSNGELVEGNHYQCVFYGGRLLSHISSADPEDSGDGVEILRVNRNACILIDSDRRAKGTKLNSTKLRVLREIESINGLGWVTDGREIENYVPFQVLKLWLVDVKLENPPQQFESVFDYLEANCPGKGKTYESKKAVLAETLNKLTKREHLASDSKLSSHLADLCARIRKWNQLPEPTPPKPITDSSHSITK
jgi:hypothetical protein